MRKRSIEGNVVLLYTESRIYSPSFTNLDAKDKSMKDFFANASHELKTPIMVIKGYSDGLRDGIVTQGKVCQIIEKETERMTALINDILEFSKLDSGIVKPHIAEYDVREILYDAAGDRGFCGAKGNSYQIRYARAAFVFM